MLTEKLRTGLGVLAMTVVVAAPGTAMAHAYVMQPAPRDVATANLDARAHKTGPCGGVPRTGKPANYATGATITVKWQETINHDGCFQIGFSPANDANFTVLKQIDDPDNADDMVRTTQVTLPAGVTCKDCTLVVRQLMNDNNTGTCVGNPADPTKALKGTYYSCADICVGPDCVADGGPTPPSDASVPEDASTPSDSGGPVTVPTDGGGKTVPADDDAGDNTPPDLRSGEGGGCSVALGATSGATFAVAAGLVGLALVRRRRRK